MEIYLARSVTDEELDLKLEVERQVKIEEENARKNDKASERS
jgi:hypothetical protein